jgi:hypothetical protein
LGVQVWHEIMFEFTIVGDSKFKLSFLLLNINGHNKNYTSM